jgi:dihydroorotate dehydrogenase electron transfer subunit
MHPRRGSYLAEVLANERICREHYRLILDVAGFPPTAPGQFVQLECRYPVEHDGARPVEWPAGQPPRFTQPELTDRETLLRRPFSLAGRRDHAGGRVELDLIYRTVGTGTRWLTSAEVGRELSVLGPLGNTFAIDDRRPVALLVGGGVGIPPMLYLADALGQAGKRTVAFCGARTAGLLPLRLEPAGQVDPAGAPTDCIAEFSAFDTPAAVATDDGSLGAQGYVHQLLEKYIEDEHIDRTSAVVYACGPEPMMKAVADGCIARDLPCQLALERRMACGMGTCQSCIVKVRADNPAGWVFKLCCHDGPVFDARDLLW